MTRSGIMEIKLKMDVTFYEMGIRIGIAGNRMVRAVDNGERGDRMILDCRAFVCKEEMGK